MTLFRRLALLLALWPVPALAQSPTVVELYQSQGCSSCPPAIANVNALVDQPGILALTFAVTYWDRLGWKDTFARPEFTARQYAYAQGLRHTNVYTPQVVIDGRADLDGTNGRDLRTAIARAAPKSGPAIAQAADGIAISAAPATGKADVWLVRYDPRLQNVAIGAGENSGVTIGHRNVVRALWHLGDWSGAAQIYTLPAGGDAAWRMAVLVQARNGGPIISAQNF
jgi:hypothetical protein